MYRKIALLFLSLFLSLFFFLPNVIQANEVEWPYQSCDEFNREYIHRVAHWAKRFDIRFPLNLFGTMIPKECFLAGALRGWKRTVVPRSHMMYCEEDDTPLDVLRDSREPCVNEEYVHMIWKSFSRMSYCFQSTQEEVENFFKVINFESGLILNARSHTGARCLGQITLPYVGHQNYLMGVYEGNPFVFPTYNEAIKRCPGLKDKKIAMDDRKVKVDCRFTHDPDTCLFYTFLGLKKYYEVISKKLKEPLNLMGGREFTPSEKKVFLLPIRFNEMLRFRGEVKGRGHVNFVFWDDSELYVFLRKWEVDIHALEVDKVPLFEDESKVRWFTTYWSHNGGSSMSWTIVPELIKKLKIKIALEKCERNQADVQICAFQKKMLEEGRGLSNGDILGYLEDEISDEYPGVKARREEVKNFVRRVLNTSEDTFGRSTLSMAHILKSGKISLNRQGRENFLKSIQKSCLPHPPFNSL